MIFRSRSAAQTPQVLANDSLKRHLAEDAAEHYFGLPIAQRRREKLLFDDSLINNPDVMNRLWGDFEGLCAVCELSLSDRDARIHRWRPTQGAVSISGKTSSKHYYWLAYEWDNLYLLCLRCSESQGLKFPISGARARVGAKGADLLGERPLLLDPCKDDAEQLLVYQKSGEVTARDLRGHTTIEVFSLNRRELVEQRREVADKAATLAREILRALDREEYVVIPGLLKRAYAKDAPFASVTRQFVNQRVQLRRALVADVMRRAGFRFEDLVGDLPRVTESVLAELNSSRRVDVPDVWDPRLAVADDSGALWSSETVGMRTTGVTRVTIKNFKGLEHISLDLASEAGSGSWTMLIGENGVGKTSVLQALALALAGPEFADRVGVSAKTFTRRGAREGYADVVLQGSGDVCSLAFSRRGPMQHDSPYPVAVAGYGATRLPHMASAKRSRYKSAEIENLFNPHASLLDTTRWIPELDLDRRASVLRSVHTALHLDSDDRLYFTKSGELRVQRGDVRLALKELSSGYQAVGSLVLDLARIFIANWDSLEAAEGLVLLDEIETHLHPRWQMKIVSSLRTAFPRVQFVATTHSPLCLRGLRDGEVRVLRSTGSGPTWVDDDLPSVEGLNADQLLTSEHFGLYSTLDEEMQQVYERYYSLLALRDPIPEQRDELQELQEKMAGRRQFGATRRERMMYEVIDNYLAQEKKVTTPSESRNLERAAYAKLTEVWVSLDA